MSDTKTICLLLSILVLLALCSVPASAQPITAPAVITSPGVYELSADARGIKDVYGIKIESSDVVIDGQGFFLGGDRRDKSVGVYVNKYGDSITNVTVKNLKMEKWATAVGYRYVKGKEGDKNEISSCDILDSTTGILIEYSDHITVTDNMIRDTSTALTIEQTSTAVFVSKNIIKESGVGVKVSNTFDVSLEDNTINTNSVYGVQVTDSSGFSITKNAISDNKYAALQIENSEDITITDNNFSRTETGPVLAIGNGVRRADIYNNYFASKENVHVDDISSNIVWNLTQKVGTNILGGPYLGGNYWGSASGMFGFSDSVKDEDGYGIGDEPFEINKFNIDHLPLVNTDKTAPAPEPEPEPDAEVLVDAEGAETPETEGDGNQTALLAVNGTDPEEVSGPESSEVVLLEPVDNSSEPAPSPVQNAFVPAGEFSSVAEDPVVFSVTNQYTALETEEQGVTADENSSDTVTEKPAQVIIPNGYLHFTGLKSGEQIALVTSGGSEILLDPVYTTSLSIPVPAGYTLYSHWKILLNAELVSGGSISRYPGPDETVVIAVQEDYLLKHDNETSPISNEEMNSTKANELSGIEDPVPVDDFGSDTVTKANGTENLTPFFVELPSSLEYLPIQNASEPLTNSSASATSGNETVSEYRSAYTVTAYAGPGGAIFPEGTVSVRTGENVTFVITPYENHQIEYLLVDGLPADTIGEYMFVNVTRDHTIIAGFI